jgi:IclR family transcriptional regulator, KDG regulon repressor
MPKRDKELPEGDKSLSPDSDSSPASFITRINNILECLSEGIYTVNDIAKSCNLSTSTTHRLLNMLKKHLFTVYDASNRRYYLGPQITKLASNPEATHQYLLASALNEMKHLSLLTEETISLNLVVGIQFFHLYEIPSKYSLRVIEETKDVHPLLPQGAAQKVLLAQLNERDLKLALKVASRWDRSFKDAASPAMIEAIGQIKQQGYAITRGEAIAESMGISAPVKNYSCPVAVGILGPEKRLSPRIPRLIKELLNSAGRVSKNLAEFIPGPEPRSR